MSSSSTRPQSSDPATRATVSVVIPAHNEEAVLARCLNALLEGTRVGEVEIVVAANGCTDRTVEIAKQYVPRVTVIDIPESSKHAALNAGDRAATVFPRVYLDADIVLRASALRAVADELNKGIAMVGCPVIDIDLSASKLLVRSFYRVWQELPWFADSPIGSGVYVLSKAGHERLKRFPDITNDDQYVHDLFTPNERVTVKSHSFVVHPPTTLSGLIKRRTRTVLGQREIAERFGEMEGTSPRVSLLAVLRRNPKLAFDIPVFAYVTLSAARASKKKIAAGDMSWERDNTSRSILPAKRADGEIDLKPSRSRLKKTAISLIDPGTWAHSLRLLHFYGYSHVQEKRKMLIGAAPKFAPNASLRNGERITLGNRVHVGERTCLWAGNSTGRILIGDDVMLAPGCFVTASDYGLVEGTPPADQPKNEQDVVIEDGVWLGANVVVVAGVTIGSGAVVGAGSVVSRDLPPNMICAGTPAKPIKPRPKPKP